MKYIAHCWCWLCQIYISNTLLTTYFWHIHTFARHSPLVSRSKYSVIVMSTNTLLFIDSHSLIHYSPDCDRRYFWLIPPPNSFIFTCRHPLFCHQELMNNSGHVNARLPRDAFFLLICQNMVRLWRQIKGEYKRVDEHTNEKFPSTFTSPFWAKELLPILTWP